MSDLAFTVHSLYEHPVKSCAGVLLDAAPLTRTGLGFDRNWMVVDAHGEMLTQRELPRLQHIAPRRVGHTLTLSAPGFEALPVPPDGPATRVRIWDDRVRAFDLGDDVAHWLGSFLGTPARLVRFDPAARRLSDPAWTGEHDAENTFSDGFPLLVASTASLALLNERLAARGQPPVTMARFRPNLVLDGLDAHGEDFLDELTIEADGGPVRLKLVKPCARCPIPNVDPLTAQRGTEPGDTLSTYRADSRLNGAVTFGMNAILLDGIGRTLRRGDHGRATIAF